MLRTLSPELLETVTRTLRRLSAEGLTALLAAILLATGATALTLALRRFQRDTLILEKGK